jgi:hypothetical protein
MRRRRFDVGIQDLGSSVGIVNLIILNKNADLWLSDLEGSIRYLELFLF